MLAIFSSTSTPIRIPAMAASTHHDSSANDFNLFRNLTQTLEQFKMPGVDMSSFVAARRKDVEALVVANTVTYEALQALARTQTDMLTQALQGMQDSAKGMLASGEHGAAGAANLEKFSESAQKAWQKMLTDMQSLAEMVHKAQTDAMAGLTARATENLGTMKGLAHAK
jgi:phasin family protein